MFNLYDENSLSYTTVAVSGVNELVLRLPAILGFNLIGKKWNSDAALWKNIRPQGITLFDSIHELIGTEIPASLIAIVEKTLGLESVAIANISRNEKPIGNFALLFSRGVSMKNIELSELFASQAGLLVERARLDTAFRETNELFAQFIKHSPIYTFIKEITATESKVLHISDNYEKMLGIPASTMLGRTMSELFPSDLAYKMNEDDKNVIAMGSILEVDEEFNGRNYTSIKFPVIQGNRSLLAGYTIDVTERENHRRELAESELRTRMMIANLPGFVYRCNNDANWTMLYMSPGCTAITGYEPEYFTGTSKGSFGSLIHADYRDVIWKNVQAAINSKMPFEQEYPLVISDGTERWIWERGRGVYSDSGTLIYIEGFITDISEKKKNEEKILALNERIHQTQKMEALGVLSAGIAHNMNNVLAAIMAAASARELQNTSSTEDAAFRHIATICKRGREHLKALSHYASPTLATMKPIDITTLTKEAAVIIGNTSMNRIEVVKSFASEQLWVAGEAGNLNSVLMNLCLNSLDAMPNGGLLEIATSPAAAGWVEITVRDTGTGMSEEVLSRIFDPFYSTKDIDKGTGLGLSMSYGIIKAHGGSLEFRSIPEKGTTARILLPRVPAPKDDAPIHPPKVESPLRLNILLVDDDEDVRFLTSRMLEKAGNTVHSTMSGEECIEYLESKSCLDKMPDLIILDQNMPRMSGVQVLDKIRQLDETIPVMISSGQPDIQEWDCFKRPYVAVIPKPFDMDEIRTVIDSLLRTSQ